MERTSSVSQFEKAIKDFSKVSLEVDSLINVGNAEAIKIKNKSIENRTEAITHEASRRLVSFKMDQKENKLKTLSNTLDTLEKSILKEVEAEFDNGVTEEKLLLRGNSEEYKSVAKDKEEVADAESASEESTEDENTDESSENESTGEGSTEEDSTEDENTDDTEEESTAEESTDGETSDKDNSDEKSTGNVNDVDAAGKVDDLTKQK